jgi:hypothetical protein
MYAYASGIEEMEMKEEMEINDGACAYMRLAYLYVCV